MEIVGPALEFAADHERVIATVTAGGLMLDAVRHRCRDLGDEAWHSVLTSRKGIATVLGTGGALVAGSKASELGLSEEVFSTAATIAGGFLSITAMNRGEDNFGRANAAKSDVEALSERQMGAEQVLAGTLGLASLSLATGAPHLGLPEVGAAIGCTKAVVASHGGETLRQTLNSVPVEVATAAVLLGTNAYTFACYAPGPMEQIVVTALTAIGLGLTFAGTENVHVKRVSAALNTIGGATMAVTNGIGAWNILRNSVIIPGGWTRAAFSALNAPFAWKHCQSLVSTFLHEEPEDIEAPSVQLQG